MINGGSAGFNSVTFYGDHYRVTATQHRNIIELQESIIEEEKLSYINDLMSRIPFIRGVWIILKEFLILRKLVLILSLGILLYFILNSNLIDENSLNIINNTLEEHSILVQIISFIFIGTMLIKLTPLGKYHAAEHMAANTFKRNKNFTVEDVIMSSRVHNSCGTNLVVFVFIFLFIFSFFIEGFMIFLASWSFGYEVVIIENRWIKKILEPFYLIGGIMQYMLFTSKPEVKHIKVAIKAIERLIELEEKFFNTRKN